jgi:hypothetical protein
VLAPAPGEPAESDDAPRPFAALEALRGKVGEGS